MKQLAFRLLQAAEWFYLRAHGWTPVTRDVWLPPPGYRGGKRTFAHRQGHAINSMKLITHRGRVR